MSGRSAFMLSLCLTVVIATGADVNRLWAATPLEDVKGTVDRVMEILKDEKLQGDTNKKEKRERLRQAILPRFDFPEMAKRALATHWNQNPQKQREFVSAFTQLLENAYAEQIEAANGDKVVYGNGRQEQNFAEVDTKVISHLLQRRRGDDQLQASPRGRGMESL